MRIEVFFASQQTDEMYLREKTVVVIDVLRASTTIAAALHNGAREIIPVTTVEAAMKIVGNLFGDVTLLGGERGGRKIEGFHLGNSPREYTEEKVKGKAIVFSTTNGSRAIVKARYARELIVCGFVNMSLVQQFLSKPARDVVILCSGRGGNFSLEDAVCAGMLIHKLKADYDTKEILCDDAGAASLALYKHYGKALEKMLARCEHGEYLADIGFADDLHVCADVDSIPVIPQLRSNVIKLNSAAAGFGT